VQLSNPDYVPSPNRSDRREGRWRKKGKISQPVGWSTQDYQGNPSSAQVLLVRNVLIDGNQNVETGFLSSFQETPILQTSQFGEAGGLTIVAREQKA